MESDLILLAASANANAAGRGGRNAQVFEIGYITWILCSENTNNYKLKINSIHSSINLPMNDELW
jgi:hypothetical protein